MSKKNNKAIKEESILSPNEKHLQNEDKIKELIYELSYSNEDKEKLFRLIELAYKEGYADGIEEWHEFEGFGLCYRKENLNDFLKDIQNIKR